MKKITLLLISISLTGFIKAQDSTAFHFSIDHLALSVKDADRSAQFYSTVLNLPEIVNRSKIPGIRWFTFADKKELHLISVIKENVSINKAIHVGLLTARFDDFVKRLDTLKIPYSDWPGVPNRINVRSDGIKQIFFQDPDGYWIEVNNVVR